MTQNQISELLDELQSNEAYNRNDAIKKIIKGKINDEQIITALKEVIEDDSSMAVRNFARAALDVFGVEHSAVEVPTIINSKKSDSEVSHTNSKAISNTPTEKTVSTYKFRDFAIGFFGWLLVWNLILYVLLISYSGSFGVMGVFMIIAIGLPFLIKRNWLGYGVLTCVITNLVGWITIALPPFNYLLFVIIIPLPMGMLLMQ